MFNNFEQISDYKKPKRLVVAQEPISNKVISYLKFLTFLTEFILTKRLKPTQKDFYEVKIQNNLLKVIYDFFFKKSVCWYSQNF